MTGHPAASADILVIGAGPAGLAAARRTAAAGRRTVVVEAEPPERAARGSVLLTPATVATVESLGLSAALQDAHRVEHVRISNGGVSTSLRWPVHPEHPEHGTVIDRRTLDVALGRLAAEAGADVWFGHEAAAPVVERGFVRGAQLVTADAARFEARAGYVVVADGANSRFGRALGSSRDPSFPWALAHHATYESAIHDATEVEIVVGLRDRADTPITGYGWMFPTGRGTVDVGVLLISTSPSFQVLTPHHVLDRFVTEYGERWHLASTPTSSGGGRIPLGRSVGPAAGPTWLLVGDATGAADPWSGAGIGAALASGSIAGDVLVEALEHGTGAPLQRYPRLLDARFEPAYGVGLLADRLLGRPSIARRVAARAAGSASVAEPFLRLATGALHPAHPGPAELAFRLARTLGVLLPGA
ncbi:MAG: NAD(P)/FAD-dependent oxidoreductase [Acidimicrobiia bacterium]